MMVCHANSQFSYDGEQDVGQNCPTQMYWKRHDNAPSVIVVKSFMEFLLSVLYVALFALL